MANRFQYKRRSSGQIIEAIQFEEVDNEMTHFMPHWFLKLLRDGVQFNPGDNRWRIQLKGKVPLALNDKWWVLRISYVKVIRRGDDQEIDGIEYAYGTCTDEYFKEEFESCGN